MMAFADRGDAGRQGPGKARISVIY